MSIEAEVDDVAVLAGDLSQAIFRLGRILRLKQVSSVSLPQISALVALSLHGPMTPGALASYEQVKPPSMTRVLALLEAAGWVERTKHPTDGRQVIVVVSEAGEALVAAERSNRRRWIADKAEQLSGEQQKTLRAAVQILMEMAQD